MNSPGEDCKLHLLPFCLAAGSLTLFMSVMVIIKGAIIDKITIAVIIIIIVITIAVMVIIMVMVMVIIIAVIITVITPSKSSRICEGACNHCRLYREGGLC